jgi:retron-type reverse transcriptase
MALAAIYEQDFVDCSYGFRPGRSAHDALSALRDELMSKRGGWVLEVDAVSFFDTLDHEQRRSVHRRAVVSRRLRHQRVRARRKHAHLLRAAVRG